MEIIPAGHKQDIVPYRETVMMTGQELATLCSQSAVTVHVPVLEIGAGCSVVVKAVSYKPEGRGFDTR
jgi:hypothetical protein